MTFNNNLQHVLSTALLAAIPFILSFYAVLNATCDDSIADCIYPLILIIALSRFLITPVRSKVSKSVLWFFLIYLILSFLSLVFPLSQYSSYSWYKISTIRFGYGIVIVFALLHLNKNDIKYLSYIFSALLIFLCSIILVDYYTSFNTEQALSFLTPFRSINKSLGYDLRAATLWNNKFTASWFVFFYWGTVVTFQLKNLKSKVFLMILFLVVLVATINLKSEGAVLALITSGLLYLICKKVNIFKYKTIYFLFFNGTIIAPLLILIFFTFSNQKFYYQEKPTYSNSIESSVMSRVPIYAATHNIIEQKPVLGYGFGSSMSIRYPDKKRNHPVYGSILPGGHPHNIVFQFMIEFGLLGVAFLLAINSYFLYFLRKFYSKNDKSHVLITLLLSFQVIFSFSFSIWKSDIVLLIIFFMLLMRIGSTQLTELTRD